MERGQLDPLPKDKGRAIKAVGRRRGERRATQIRILLLPWLVIDILIPIAAFRDGARVVDRLLDGTGFPIGLWQRAGTRPACGMRCDRRIHATARASKDEHGQKHRPQHGEHACMPLAHGCPPGYWLVGMSVLSANDRTVSCCCSSTQTNQVARAFDARSASISPTLRAPKTSGTGAAGARSGTSAAVAWRLACQLPLPGTLQLAYWVTGSRWFGLPQQLQIATRRSAVGS